MIERLAGYARLGAKLLAIEMLLPGGTLVVLALLLARRFSHAGSQGLA